MRISHISYTIAIAIILFLAGCSPNSHDADATAHIPNIKAENGFMFAPIPGKTVTSGGIEITSDINLTFIAANAQNARVELHTMAMIDGMMKMRPADRFEIEANQTFMLGDSGPHFMIYGVTETQTQLPVELVFVGSKGETFTISAELQVRTR